MLIYECFYLAVSGPLIQYVQEIQPWCIITAITSQSHNELSTNVPLLAEITPTTSLVVEIPETSENPTLYVPLHQQQNGYPNNNEVYNTCVTVCVLHVALAWS